MTDSGVRQMLERRRVVAGWCSREMSGAAPPRLRTAEPATRIDSRPAGIELEIIAVPDDRNPETLAVIHAMPIEFRRARAMAKKAKVEYVVGPDLDFDEEKFILKDGRRLTNELADQITEETLAEVRRRNLRVVSRYRGGGVHSPRVQFRVA
jgi:hypothetical protein